MSKKEHDFGDKVVRNKTLAILHEVETKIDSERFYV